MKQYDVLQLRAVLNFDTHKEKDFDLVERNQIHRAISKSLDGSEYSLTPNLSKKIKEVLGSISITNYKVRQVHYYLDDDTMHVKSTITF